jgi:L-ascorbate metabolism protein UlaG (beta-lactamase superfamily)
MTTIQRLTDSCLTVTTDAGTTLLDPGFHTFDTGEFDLATLGEVQRILITHEHGDHVKPEFVSWLLDRGDDVSVYSNQAVADLLAPHDINVLTQEPSGVTTQDVVHGMTPMGTAPPNRAFTVEGVLTHPGDSFEPTTTGTVLALPLLIPWGSTTEAVEFARRLAPQQAIPIHDFALSALGRNWVNGMTKNVLAKSGIEFIPLGWGESFTI